MKIPRLTAEFATRPPLGGYLSAPSDAGPASVVPMGPLLRAMDPNNPYTFAQLVNFKESGGNPCGPGENVCWSQSPNPLNSYDFICCNSAEGCVQKANGDPGCQLGATGITAINTTDAPDPIKAVIRSYVN